MSRVCRFILFVILIAFLSSCGHGDDVANPGSGEFGDKSTTVQVANDGTLNYTGTGDFQGLYISFKNADVAGKKIRITKRHCLLTLQTIECMSQMLMTYHL